MKRLFKTFALIELLQGLWLTLRVLFRKKITVRYPEERTPYSERFRGLHVLMTKEDGTDRCVGCKLCEAACPTKAITIVSGDNGKGGRSAVSYEIDLKKCIYCGYCEEACPEAAIMQTQMFEFTGEKRSELVFDKKLLTAVGNRWRDDILATKDKVTR